MKIISRRFHVKTPFMFWDLRTWDMWKVCLQTFRNNRTCWKLAYFLRNLQTSRDKNAKFSGYCFYMNTNIKGHFQICISVPLSHCISVFVCISRLMEKVSNSFPQAYRVVSPAKLQICVSFIKRSKLVIKTLKRIGPSIDPCVTIHLRTNQLLCFLVFGIDNFVWVLKCFRQLHIPLALQLPNHDWHSHKLLISPLTVFQQFRQTHQETFAILENIYRGILSTVPFPESTEQRWKKPNWKT